MTEDAGMEAACFLIGVVSGYVLCLVVEIKKLTNATPPKPRQATNEEPDPADWWKDEQ